MTTACFLDGKSGLEPSPRRMAVSLFATRYAWARFATPLVLQPYYQAKLILSTHILRY